jgi:hypothetical protein
MSDRDDRDTQGDEDPGEQKALEEAFRLEAEELVKEAEQITAEEED